MHSSYLLGNVIVQQHLILGDNYQPSVWCTCVAVAIPFQCVLTHHGWTMLHLEAHQANAYLVEKAKPSDHAHLLAFLTSRSQGSNCIKIFKRRCCAIL